MQPPPRPPRRYNIGADRGPAAHWKDRLKAACIDRAHALRATHIETYRTHAEAAALSVAPYNQHGYLDASSVQVAAAAWRHASASSSPVRSAPSSPVSPVRGGGGSPLLGMLQPVLPPVTVDPAETQAFVHALMAQFAPEELSGPAYDLVMAELAGEFERALQAGEFAGGAGADGDTSGGCALDEALAAQAQYEFEQREAADAEREYLAQLCPPDEYQPSHHYAAAAAPSLPPLPAAPAEFDPYIAVAEHFFGPQAYASPQYAAAPAFSASSSLLLAPYDHWAYTAPAPAPAPASTSASASWSAVLADDEEYALQQLEAQLAEQQRLSSSAMD